MNPLVESKKRYPLEPLLRKRETEVDTQARTLRERVDAAHQATLNRQRAAIEREEHEQLTVQKTQQEADRFDDGHASVQDIACLHAWRIAQDCRATVLKQKEVAEIGRERSARQREDEARQHLAHARASAKVIEQHRQRYRAELQRAEERKAESEAEDLVNAQFARALWRQT